MGPGIVIPVVIVAVVVPTVFTWARRRFKENPKSDETPPTAPAMRLTSNALRSLPSPPWRVVYEIGPDRLGGIEHVLIGAPGIFAVVTSMDPMPAAPANDTTDPHLVAQAAIRRGALDDALRRCKMASDRLVTVHWGVAESPTAVDIETVAGATAVDGRRITEWIETLTTANLTQAQIDLAWQTVVTAIGRPDPLA